MHKETFTQRSFFTQMLLHTEAFTWRSLRTHRNFYTEKSLHRGAFTHRCFCTEKSLHRRAFTHRCFYTQKFLRKEVFTQEGLLPAGAFTHRNFYREVFTQSSFCKQTRLHRGAFTQWSFYTHTDAFTQRSFYTQQMHCQLSWPMQSWRDFHPVFTRTVLSVHQRPTLRKKTKVQAQTTSTAGILNCTHMVISADCAPLDLKTWPLLQLCQPVTKWSDCRVRFLEARSTFEMQKLLHFTQRRPYTQTRLHREAFTQRSLHTQKLLRREVFTQRSF